MTNLVAGFLEVVKDLNFSTPNLHALADEDAAFAEFSGGSTVIASGRKYAQDYAFYLRARDGKIVFVREYMSSLKSMKAFS